MPSSSQSPLGVAIVGGGVVGGGAARLLRAQSALIARRCGRPVRITHIVKRDLNNIAHLGDGVAGLLTDDWRKAVNDEATDIVVELMGGCDAAADCIRAALAAGKPVVTANKALLAGMAADDDIARGNVSYEAAVAGCIPAVKILREALAGDAVREIYGVINGTCNYILTAMESEKISFAEALKNAQALGYAEADPALDIDGMDAAHKLLLIARLAFAADARMEDFPVAGVRDFDWRDIVFAAQFKFRVKLLAAAKRDGDKVHLRVCPALIPREHPLAAVEGATNAVVVRGDFSGETMYCGAGAGAEATAVAVVADIIDAARRRNIGGGGGGDGDAEGEARPRATARFCAPHYLRLRVTDRPGVLADITRILAAQNISIEAIHQNESLPGQSVDVIILLHAAADDAVSEAAGEIRRLDAVGAPAVTLPIERLS